MFPAPAGINRKIVLNDSPRGRVPRASGDKPQEWLETVVKPSGDKPNPDDHEYFWRQCSPRQRG
ncbi:hypothetical protein SA04_0115 [Salmonella enterica subsp. enterica serovar Agona str. 04.O.05]|nr:hypothetical protein SA04_0115 [Salmonella enterica subsp. enterica serovar Agona str. 04.O.05]